MAGRTMVGSWGGSLPAVVGLVGDEEADSVGGVVVGSGECAGCVLGLRMGLGSLWSVLAEYQGSLLC